MEKIKEIFSNLRDKFNDLTPPAKLGIIGGVLIIGYFLLFKKPEEISSGTYAAGLSGASSGGGSDVSDSGSEADRLFNDNEMLISENQQLTDSFNKVTADFMDYRSQNESIFSEVLATNESLKAEAAFLTAAVSTNIYQDSTPDYQQFSSVLSSVNSAQKSGTISKDTANATIKSVAGLGNNGRNPDGTEATKNPTLTASERQSEIVRANAVLENRKAQGLDTSKQESYLKFLTK